LSKSDKARAAKEKREKGRVSKYGHGGQYRGKMADKNMCCCGARMSRLNEQHG